MVSGKGVLLYGQPTNPQTGDSTTGLEDSGTRGRQQSSAIIVLTGSSTLMEEEIPSIRIPTEAYMEEAPASGAAARRNEDIALDLMKFVAMTTGYGRTTASGVGFQGAGAASKPEEYTSHLLELYGRCLQAVQGKK
jgi:hypothetical protein